MAFDESNWSKISSGYGHIVSPQMWSYFSLIDDIAATFSSGYFNDVEDEMEIGDLVVIRPPLIPSIATVLGHLITKNPAVVGPTVGNESIGAQAVSTDKILDSAITAAKIDTDAVTTVKIQDLAVTKEKLALNIQPFSIVIHNSQVFATAALGANPTFAIAGVLQTDFGFAIVQSPGIPQVDIIGSFAVQAPTSGVEVILSAVPGNNIPLMLTVFRPV